jgi:hypothetical protein
VTNLPLSQLTSFQPSFRGSFQPEPAGEEEGAPGGEGAFDPKEHEEAFGQHGCVGRAGVMWLLRQAAIPSHLPTLTISLIGLELGQEEP